MPPVAATREELHAKQHDWARQAGGNGPHLYLRLYLDPAATDTQRLDAAIDAVKTTHYKQHFDASAEEFMLLFNRQHYGAYLASGPDAIPRAGDAAATYEIAFSRPLILFTRFWARPQAAVCDRAVLAALTATDCLSLQRWDVAYGGGTADRRVVHGDEGAASLYQYMKLDKAAP